MYSSSNCSFSNEMFRSASTLSFSSSKVLGQRFANVARDSQPDRRLGLRYDASAGRDKGNAC